MDDPRSRAAGFCARFGIRVPILLAPMAGACPPSSSVAVMRAGGFGACAALLMQPKGMEELGPLKCARMWLDGFRLIFRFPSRRQCAIVRMKCAFANFCRAWALRP